MISSVILIYTGGIIGVSNNDRLKTLADASLCSFNDTAYRMSFYAGTDPTLRSSQSSTTGTEQSGPLASNSLGTTAANAVS